jgi:pyruvate/2-oxoglutarate/acetoin dehydrogenase E1 component
VLESVARTKRAIVTHQATRFLGPGAEIAAIITEALSADLAAPVVRLGADFAPVPFSTALSVFPTAERIVEEARTLVHR